MWKMIINWEDKNLLKTMSIMNDNMVDCMYILNTIIVELTNSYWLHTKKFIFVSYSIITMPKCIRKCNAKLLRT